MFSAHVPPAAQHAAAVTVRPGDTLSGIAKRDMGSAAKWPALYHANEKTVGADPNLIFAGERLTVPQGSFGGSAPVVAPAKVVTAAVDPPAPAPQSVSLAGGGLLVIAKFLEAHGYSRAAAAGIAGDIAGESGGNPESQGDGGGGLIGWTPIGSAGPDQPIITGNPARDLATQLIDLLAYNQNDARYLPALDGAGNPTTAGQIYSQYFERPAVLYSDTRPAIAQTIYVELG